MFYQAAIMRTFSRVDSRLIHQPFLAPSVLRVGFLEVVVGTFHIAAATGGEHVEGLAAQVVGFDEGVDDGRGGVPPHGEANPHHIVIGDVLATSINGRARGLVVHFDGRA